MDFPQKTKDWLYSGKIQFYIYSRKENKIQNPGSEHLHCASWFESIPQVFKDPFDVKERLFGEMIYALDDMAFSSINLVSPRWVFYDCAILPGLVCGVACHESLLPGKAQKIFRLFSHESSWVPISLFIIVPTLRPNEWVAQNLCTLNSVLDKPDRLYGLAFISKAFGLWFANVRQCLGMTQWNNPALKIHCQYGLLELVSAYTPIHSHANTMTYQCKVDDRMWPYFFHKAPASLRESFKDNHRGFFSMNPIDTSSQMFLQSKLTERKSPIYLNSWEISEARGCPSLITLWEKKPSL